MSNPETVQFCIILPEPPKPSKLRRQQRRDGGYDMVPAYTTEELLSFAEKAVRQDREDAAVLAQATGSTS